MNNRFTRFIGGAWNASICFMLSPIHYDSILMSSFKWVTIVMYALSSVFHFMKVFEEEKD